MEKEKKTNKYEILDIIASILFILFIILVLVIGFVSMVYDLYPSKEISPYEQGYQNATRDILVTQNNQYIRDLNLYGITYQNVYVNNQTFIMECMLKQ